MGDRPVAVVGASTGELTTAAALRRQAGRKNRASGGHSYLHTAVDDHSRLAYSEILTDEKTETATGFWTRARRSSPRPGSPSSEY